MKKIFVFCTLLLVSLLTFSQSNSLLQKWHFINAHKCSDDSLLKDETKWNITFKENNKARIYIPYSNLDTEYNFLKRDDKLFINSIEYQIDKINNDSLVLVLEDNISCKKLFFASESGLNSLQKEKFFMYKNDTVYFTTRYNYPKMKKYGNYKNYFIRNTPYKNKNGCQLDFRFIVNKKGEVVEPIGKISCLKKPEKVVQKLIDNMNGLWEPMYIDNKPVSTYVKVIVNYKNAGIINELK
ncbi:MAG: hypothetical protein ABFR32_13155 [Bacteroidota bacterium]